MAKRAAIGLRDIARKPAITPPRVNPRVTRQRAVQLLRKVPSGARLLRQRQAMAAPTVPAEIVFFTARIRTGNVGFIDFYNADLRAEFSDVARTYQNDQVYFDANRETAYDDISLKHPNGVVQAFFETEEEGQVLVVAKLSSAGARVYLTLDSGSYYGQSFTVQGNGVELAILKLRAAGVHRVNIIQRKNPAKPLWFHSITILQL